MRGHVSTLLSLGAGFNRELSGRENILLNAAFLGISRKEIGARMEAIVDFADLGEFIDQPIRFYSNGMRSRLGFAIATTLDPEILVLDEVLSVGRSGVPGQEPGAHRGDDGAQPPDRDRVPRDVVPAQRVHALPLARPRARARLRRRRARCSTPTSRRWAASTSAVIDESEV